MPKIDQKPVIGIIGGSGIYEIDGLKESRWENVTSFFGNASDKLLFGKLGKQELVFLPRHGRGHRIPPSKINFRANIDVLKRAGVTKILSLSACGSLREKLSPGTFVIVDQFIDRTFARVKSFFGEGLVAHVSFGEPVCSYLCNCLEQTLNTLNVPHQKGGTYLAMEGPQFSTLAESKLYRSWGCDVIGMTNMPEAKLAREAEICYASVAMVTDYDCWHPNHDNVSVDTVIKALSANADRAREVIKNVVPNLSTSSDSCTQGCASALEHAIITQSEARDPEMIKKLRYVAGRLIN